MVTRTLADLLDRERDGPLAVGRFSLTAPEGDVLSGASHGARLRHALGARGRLRDWVAARPPGPVLWPAVSPSPLGHLRDIGVVLPALGGEREIYAVVHRGDFHTLFQHPVTRWTASRLVRRVAGVVFLSEGLAERCSTWIPSAKRLVVPNTIGPDVEASPEAARTKAEREIGGRPLRLLFLSGMIPSKGYLVVLDAVAELLRRGVAVEATFAGRWPSAEAEQAFHARAEASGAARAVTHLGGVSDRAAVGRLFAEADLFLLPTTYPIEAQPLTILEALSAGTPVISTRHASIPEMIEDDTSGLLVAPEAGPLADAVERAAEPERWRALSQGARARYDAAFSPAAVRDRWLDLLASIA
ncbi:MAG: glycosyltransferase [Bacteroidota bacterium]